MTTTPESRLVIAANDVLAEAKTIEFTSTLVKVRIGVGENPDVGLYLDLERDGNGNYSVAEYHRAFDTAAGDKNPFKSQPLPYDKAVANAVDVLSKRIARNRLVETINRVIDPEPADTYAELPPAGAKQGAALAAVVD